ncbi:TonB-dependent receptor [Sphingomonas sp. MMSM20]|uniref:TonB-dependent receptor n=1 Tax=Sphingomonas lycopersici TaxID=2951807 RepID=UPI002238B7BD|nr:TonB-dependent receptor [Sphingomonas lycopersici]MCW6529057.1 TonB-dependent receptor [Sphingomonas lycopersici]
MSRFKSATRLGALLTLGLTAPALAQTDAPSPPQADNAIGDILVTARKRSERLQDTPISISAETAESMARKGIANIADIARQTPGLQYGDFGDMKLSPTSLRGVTGSSGSAGADPAIGYYVDEIYQAQGPGADLDLYDIARVEVLRGPQGTLFGRNTIGGVISITTERPSDTFAASVTADIGNYDARRIGASISGPIVPGAIAGKLAFVKDQRGGFERNVWLNRDVNNHDSWALRGQLLFDLGTTTSLLLTGSYRAADQEQLVFETRRYNLDADLPKALVALGLPLNTDPFDRKVYSDSPNKERLRAWDVAATFKTRIGDVGVTNVAAYHWHDYFSRADTDRSPLKMLYDGDPERVWRWSEELRFDLSTGPIDWLAGLYYFRQKSRNQSFVEIGADLAANLGAPELAGFRSGSNGELDTTSKAAFLSATWKIAPRLDLTLGGRYTRDEKTIHYVQVDAIDLLGGNTDVRASGAWSQFTPNANLRFRITPTVMAYATASKGFKSGGFNDALGSADGIAFGPESLWNYELGLKTESFNRRLVINAALYYMKWDKIQLSEDNPATPVYDPIILNGGRAHSKGIEVEMTARPTDRLTLGGNVSLQDAKYENGHLPTGEPLNHIPYAPGYTGGANAEYRLPVAQWGTLAFYGEYLLRGRTYLTNDADPDGVVHPYGLLNLRLSLQSPDERWRVTLWAKNLTNRIYEERVFDLSGQTLIGQKFIILGDPRTVGVEFKLKY